MSTLVNRGRQHNTGVVALEFLLLFPFVIAMLYAAAIYALVFSSQYRLQNMAERAVTSALYVDRSAYAGNALGGEVVGRAQEVLAELQQRQTGPLKTVNVNCQVINLGEESGESEDATKLELLRCRLTYNYKANPIVPAISFGALGTFPPLPDELTAEAHAAF